MNTLWQWFRIIGSFALVYFGHPYLGVTFALFFDITWS